MVPQSCDFPNFSRFATLLVGFQACCSLPNSRSKSPIFGTEGSSPSGRSGPWMTFWTLYDPISEAAITLAKLEPYEYSAVS